MYTPLIVTLWMTDNATVRMMLTWPLGAVETITLDHDWSADMWDWRGGRLPESATRYLRRRGLRLHGERSVYVSPADVGTGTNEQGRVMVYEVDYETDQ